MRKIMKTSVCSPARMKAHGSGNVFGLAGNLFAGLLVVYCLHAVTLSARDWLIDPSPFVAKVTPRSDGSEIELANGLVRRVIRLQPNAATVAYDNLMTDESLLRSVRPEASVTLGDVKYEVGGLTGQPVHSYLDAAWIAELKANPRAFRFAGLKTGRTEARFPWKKHPEWMPQDLPWPPPGVSLTLEFVAPEGASSLKDVAVEVHYELYDGIPLLSKWIVVRNRADKPVRLNSFMSEILAAVEYESYVDNNPRWEWPNLYVETDYAFGGMGSKGGNKGVHWVADPEYKSQVNYERNTPCLLECRPPLGPDQVIAPGGSFESFRAFELVQDSTERERKGLAQRRMYRTIAPWVTENPVLMHVRSARPEAVKLAVDQCAEVGFEMVIMTFGSGFDFEKRDKGYQASIKELADYASAKNIALGGYSLLASRGAATTNDNTIGPTAFGVMPCLGAQWGVDYLAQLKDFISTAGLGVLEHDGSYPGDTCASTNHPFHRGLEDSQWVQWRAITDFYKWCRSEGVYLNIPDWYFLSGGSKTGMGYREVNWSLPRAYQEIIERQNIFDGTWEKTPSMGWMFVPLTEYQGGGAGATIEPLKEHLPHYETRLANLFGAGVIACYRGPRLYDSDETEAAVKHWVDFYRQHRAILNSDLIHLRRADGRDWDGWLHVNPALKECGLAVLYNPLPEAIQRRIQLPLYYTGLTNEAILRQQDGPAERFTLNRDYSVEPTITLPAKGRVWISIEAP
jgi:hypothetical protein